VLALLRRQQFSCRHEGLKGSELLILVLAMMREDVISGEAKQRWRLHDCSAFPAQHLCKYFAGAQTGVSRNSSSAG
jgi:hypothetical protein